MKRHLRSRLKKKSKMQYLGRVRPMVLSLLIILVGVLTDNDWWWKVGLIMLISLFIGGYYRYRTPH